MNALEFAASFASDRLVTVGVLGLRVRQYVCEGILGQPVSDLSVRSTRSDESPLYHASTGIYGFLDLKPGQHRIHVVDPVGRFLPLAKDVDVPNREAARTLLMAGLAPPGRLPDTAYPTALARPAVGYPVSGGETVVWGSVREPAGRPVPFARIRIETKFKGGDNGVVTYSDLAGVYLARLPGERPDFTLPAPDEVPPEPVPGPLVTPPADTDDDPTELIVEFERDITVHRLRDEPDETLGSSEALRVFPADFDELDPDAADSPYRAPVGVELWPGGVAPGDPKPTKIMVHVGRRARWDIVLT